MDKDNISHSFKGIPGMIARATRCRADRYSLVRHADSCNERILVSLPNWFWASQFDGEVPRCAGATNGTVILLAYIDYILLLIV